MTTTEETELLYIYIFDPITISGANNVQSVHYSLTRPPLARLTPMMTKYDVLSFKGSYRFINQVKRCYTVLLSNIKHQWRDSVNHPSSFE